MKVLKNEEIKKLIDLREAMKIMKATFVQISQKKVIMPKRISLTIKNKKGTMLFMPGYLKENKALGIKIIGVFIENYQKGIPTISGLIILNNPETGEPISVMDAQYITSLRTAATSAIATDLLALKDSKKLGIFGAGIQAKWQIKAILEVRDIKTVKIFDLEQNKAKKLASEMRKLEGNSCDFRAVNSPEEIVIDSNIIITATTSKSPVFDGHLLKEGMHVNAIGAFKPQYRELDDLTITKSKIFVDSYSACLKEAGDLIIPLKKGIISKYHICSELGDLILKRKKGRENEKEITLFKSVGLAVQDIAIAQKIYLKAKKYGLGKDISLDFNELVHEKRI